MAATGGDAGVEFLAESGIAGMAPSGWDGQERLSICDYHLQWTNIGPPSCRRSVRMIHIAGYSDAVFDCLASFHSVETPCDRDVAKRCLFVVATAPPLLPDERLIDRRGRERRGVWEGNGRGR